MFEGTNICLRGFELEDAPIIAQYYNDLDVRRFLDHPIPLSLQDAEEWIQNTWETAKKGKAYFFAIALKESNRLIGTCGLFGISQINRKAELMIVIYNKKYWGKGFGTEAIHLLLNYGFRQLNLHRIFLFTHTSNTRAQRIYEKIGFKPSGRRRQASFFEGTYHDLLLYDLLASEFQD
jgi:RimJ/RimL family protein N-acetyltransferase